VPGLRADAEGLTELIMRYNDSTDEKGQALIPRTLQFNCFYGSPYAGISSFLVFPDTRSGMLP